MVPNPGRLADLLDVYRSEDDAGMSPEDRDTFLREGVWLRRSGWDDEVPKVGEEVPDTAMPDTETTAVSLLDLARAGPLILKFYRGRWCPYCTLDMRAWERATPELSSLGARFVAVTPQSEDEIALIRERDGLSFHVVSDRELVLPRAFGIAYEVQEEVRDVYRRRGLDASANHASREWTLPLPACFVIGRDGRIACSHVDPDYTRRAEPADMLAVLSRFSEG